MSTNTQSESEWTAEEFFDIPKEDDQEQNIGVGIGLKGDVVISSKSLRISAKFQKKDEAVSAAGWDSADVTSPSFQSIDERDDVREKLSVGDDIYIQLKNSSETHSSSSGMGSFQDASRDFEEMEEDAALHSRIGSQSGAGGQFNPWREFESHGSSKFSAAQNIQVSSTRGVGAPNVDILTDSAMLTARSHNTPTSSEDFDFFDDVLRPDEDGPDTFSTNLSEPEPDISYNDDVTGTGFLLTPSSSTDPWDANCRQEEEESKLEDTECVEKYLDNKRQTSSRRKEIDDKHLRDVRQFEEQQHHQQQIDVKLQPQEKNQSSLDEDHLEKKREIEQQVDVQQILDAQQTEIRHYGVATRALREHESKWVQQEPDARQHRQEELHAKQVEVELEAEHLIEEAELLKVRQEELLCQKDTQKKRELKEKFKLDEQKLEEEEHLEVKRQLERQQCAEKEQEKACISEAGEEQCKVKTEQSCYREIETICKLVETERIMQRLEAKRLLEAQQHLKMSEEADSLQRDEETKHKAIEEKCVQREQELLSRKEMDAKREMIVQKSLQKATNVEKSMDEPHQYEQEQLLWKKEEWGKQDDKRLQSELDTARKLEGKQRIQEQLEETRKVEEAQRSEALRVEKESLRIQSTIKLKKIETECPKMQHLEEELQRSKVKEQKHATEKSMLIEERKHVTRAAMKLCVSELGIPATSYSFDKSKENENKNKLKAATTTADSTALTEKSKTALEGLFLPFSFVPSSNDIEAKDNVVEDKKTLNEIRASKESALTLRKGMDSSATRVVSVVRQNPFDDAFSTTSTPLCQSAKPNITFLDHGAKAKDESSSASTDSDISEVTEIEYGPMWQRAQELLREEEAKAAAAKVRALRESRRAIKSQRQCSPPRSPISSAHITTQIQKETTNLTNYALASKETELVEMNKKNLLAKTLDWATGPSVADEEVSVSVGERALGDPRRSPKDIKNTLSVPAQPPHVVQVMVFGVIGLFCGFLGSIFVQTTCHFATARVAVGNSVEEFELHAGMWEYSPIDSVYTGYSYCYPYEHEYGPTSPYLARGCGLIAVMAGAVAITVLWVYLIFIRTSELLWKCGIHMATLAAIAQSCTFSFFKSDFCVQNSCSIGPGAIVSFLSLGSWFALAYFMHRNSPTLAQIKSSNEASFLEMTADRLGLRERLTGMGFIMERKIPVSSFSKISKTRQVDRIQKTELDLGGVHESRSYLPPIYEHIAV